MTRACKTLHQIEFTDADGARKTIPAGKVVEPGIIPTDEFDTLLGLKAVRRFHPLDLDRDGDPGGSKRGRRRKMVSPVEPPAAPADDFAILREDPATLVDDGLFD